MAKLYVVGVIVASTALAAINCAPAPAADGTPHSASVSTSRTTRPTGQPTSPARHKRTPAVAHPTKVLTIIEENHSFYQEKSGMPYLWSLAQTYGYASNYHAITHPSLPNYLAIAGGSTFGISDDNNPSVHPLSGPSIYDQALDNGQTAGAYAESMPSNCYQTNASPYLVRHNPWTYFTDSAARCKTYDVSTSTFASDVKSDNLPVVGTLTPNANDDAHDGTLTQADNYLKSVMPAILASSDFTSGRLAVVITTDESADSDPANQVLTVVCDANLHGVVVTTNLNHYSLARFYAETVGVAPLRNAASAPDMRAAFGL